LPFGSLSIPTPVFAWLGTTIGGILLFLFLIRRRPRDDSPSLATFVLESPGPVAPSTPSAPPAAAAVPPPVSTPPPMGSMASAVKAAKPAKKARTTKPASQASAPATPAAAAAVVAVAAVEPTSAFPKRPAKGVERVFVSYQGVRMAAMPDEFSSMLARLERGDEVEIVGSQDGYLNVRTPVGLTGWIPRVTVTSVRPSVRGGSKPSRN
jgi:hypothetical protein